MSQREFARVLVTDLDNTLFDWFKFWYLSFTALIDELALTSGVDKETLLDDAYEIHQRHGTSEYSFLIQEMKSLRAKHGEAANLAKIYDSAIHAFRSQRKANLELYPTVMESLLELKRRGTLVVAYTESMGYYSAWRVKRLGLDGILDVLYSQEDHDLPGQLSTDQVRALPAEHYELSHTRHSHTPRGEVKPNPDILRHILASVDAAPSDAIYVGDSLTKDIVMAQRAGVQDVYAEYGTDYLRKHEELYNLLRRVTHWTPAMVEEEREISKLKANPSFTMEREFGELLTLFDFVAFSPGAPTA